MIYPEFVPDQLLTSEHLNQLFGYLEEQNRLTRTNLIGMGIVCGLEVSINPERSQITISKGCGVTSEGYLATIDETNNTYTAYKEFNAVQELMYDQFVDGSKNPRFHIDELWPVSTETGTTALNSPAGYLDDKVVLLFVEILKEGAKNCNPNSCDDKGIQVTVTVRPLLIKKTDADALAIAKSAINKLAVNLPDVKMRRYDVPATSLIDTADIFEAYQNIMDALFLEKTGKALSEAYTVFAPLVIDLYPANPFTGLAGNFKFLHDGNINDQQLINLQYFYDLFSDLLLAYDEIKKKGSELLSACCPDSNMFPRHLFLDAAIPDLTLIKSLHRHYFIPSPVLDGKEHLRKELRILFKRMVLLIQKFYTPPAVVAGKRNGVDENIRITPGLLGPAPLSQRSIPFYYQIEDASDELLQHWDYKKYSQNKADKNLSYHARDYNVTNDDVVNPLLYDLEPFNFLRIEGHLGKSYTSALRNILMLKKQFRLPFEVVALSADVKGLQKQITDLIKRTSATGLSGLFADQKQPQCQFQDLESLYDTLAAGLTCSLCQEMKYFYDLPTSRQAQPEPVLSVPQVSLLKKCDPEFRYKSDTLGQDFEDFYERIQGQAYLNPEVFLNSIFDRTTLAVADRDNGNIGIALLYYVEELSETISNDLSTFDISVFNIRYNDLLTVAQYLKITFAKAPERDNQAFNKEDFIDHLDALLYACKQAQFTALNKDYLTRWLYVMLLQRFGYFVKTHPGIQHKAGVPIGGTFILVYHERFEQPQNPDDNTVRPVIVPGRPGIVDIGTVRGDVTDTGPGIGVRRQVKSKAEKEKLAQTEKERLEMTRETTKILSEFMGTKLTSRDQLEKIEVLLTEKVDMNQRLESLVADIGDGVVIADFYLPYLCCSDCPPVHFMLNEEAPTEKLTIAIDTKEFCSDDRKAYPVKVSPEGGELKGEGIAINTSRDSTFNPSQVVLNDIIQKNITLSYTKGSQTVSATVAVHQKPKAAFEFTRSRLPNQISFINKSVFGVLSLWDFGDGQKSEEENPVHSYAAEGKFKVALTVKNGVCPDASSVQEIEINNEELSINLKIREFCSNDKTAYKVLISPPGGEVEGEGTRSMATGEFVFVPAEIAIADLKQKEVGLAYIKDGLEVKTTILVYHKPQARFDVSRTSANNQISFINASVFAERFEWDFGDQTKSEETNPTHEFAGEGSFNILLKAFNGICSDETTQVVDVKNPVQKTCLPLARLLEQFKGFAATDTRLFTLFKENFASYFKIEEVFGRVPDIFGITNEEQVKFFADIKIVELLESSVSELHEMILRSDFDVFAIEMYRILINLAMYIQCIQKGDSGRDEINLASVFKLIESRLAEIKKMSDATGKFKETLKQLLSDFQSELQRITDNNEELIKKVYATLLQKLTKILVP